MPEYEKMGGPEESDRAPRGLCEITIQIFTHRAFDIQAPFEKLLHDHLDPNYETKAFDMDNGGSSARIVVYTGTDRLGMDELRDIAELYGMASRYENGNIPPNMSIMVAQDELDDENAMVWLEFKLEKELPLKQVKTALVSELGQTDITPKHPEGTDMKAMQFRENNYAYNTVREAIHTGNAIVDSLPSEYVQLVCET